MSRSVEKCNDLLHLPYFTALDRHFARLMLRLAGGDDSELALAAALVSRKTGMGDICLDLRMAGGKPLDDDEDAARGIVLPDGERWIQKLRASDVVGASGEYRPLILDGKGRLYLYRYWQYETRLAGSIMKRAADVPGEVNAALLKEGIERMFPKAGGGPDWQRIAAAAAVMRRFCVISGGPGTGKTSTVVKILALLIEQALENGAPPAIMLAAPTGKAAARLRESCKAALATLRCSDDVKSHIPDSASTLHRLLGAVPGSPYFRKNADNPLACDVLVIDECSMADLPLLAKTFEAAPDCSRILLLGDKDQLSSVEAGAVLGDICDTGNEHGYSRRFISMAAETAGQAIDSSEARDDEPPVADSRVILRKSFRFAGESGIGVVSAAVRDGDAERAIDALACGRYKDIAFVDMARRNPTEFGSVLATRIIDGFAPYCASRSPEDAFARFSSFSILCARRQGPHGVEGMNALVEDILRRKGLVDPAGVWYSHRPIMVLENDYNLELFNGDVGIVLPDASHGSAPRVWFPSKDGAFRNLPISRLPAHETVFAMTVHKSQGSEFNTVLVMLSDRFSPVMSRELLYTAITRARTGVEIWASEAVLRTVIENPVRRQSGLRDRLWG